MNRAGLARELAGLPFPLALPLAASVRSARTESLTQAALRLQPLTVAKDRRGPNERPQMAGKLNPSLSPKAALCAAVSLSPPYLSPPNPVSERTFLGKQTKKQQLQC